MEQYLNKLKNKQNLSFEESKAAFEILMDGKASEDQIFDFLTFFQQRVKLQMRLLEEFMF